MLTKFKSSAYSDQTFIFLIGLGAVLSMQMSWVPGFFHDGYLYGAFGKNAAELGHWIVPHHSPFSYPRFEQHLPTVFILEGLFFKVFGTSYTSARIFISIFYLLTGFGIFKMLNEREEKRLGYYSLFLFFIIPPLMKKVRFPNLDIPLMCTVFWGFYFYLKALDGRKNSWYLTGLFFGLSLLIKGPMGALLPIGIVLHLIFSKSLINLKNIHAWGGLGLGFFLFALWPISLYLTDNFQIFLDWYKFTFVITLGKSRGVAEPFYTYFVFLLKQAPLWLGLLLLSLYKIRKNSLHFASTVFFFGLLVILSIPKFKYSNYLIPLYPFMAIGAAFGVKCLGEKIYDKLHHFFVGLIFLISLVLLIFPLTNKSKRDSGIHDLKEILQATRVPIKRWINVTGVYSGGALTSINAFEGGTPVSVESFSQIIEWEEAQFKELLIVASFKDSKELERKFPKLSPIARISDYGVQVLMHRGTFAVSSIFEL